MGQRHQPLLAQVFPATSLWSPERLSGLGKEPRGLGKQGCPC